MQATSHRVLDAIERLQPQAPSGRFPLSHPQYRKLPGIAMPHFKMSEVAVPLGVDIWQMAFLMEQRYGADAMLESGMLAEHLLEDGACQGAAMWQRIRDAIAWLQAKAPAEGEAVH